MKREVWLGSAQEGTVTIGIEDGTGGYTDLLTVEYAQDFNVVQLQEEITEHQPGKASPDFDWYPAGYDVSVGELYLRKLTQVDPMLVRGRQFRIALDLVNPKYSGVVPLENDSWVFRDARVRLERLDVPDNDLANYALKFRAERME